MLWREAVLVQLISRLHQVGGLLRLCVSWAASGGRAVGWKTLRRCPRRLGLTWRTLLFLHGGGGGCTDTAQLHASLPSRRFASTVRRLGGLLRPGGRLAAALMLSESAVVDLAVGGFLAHIAFCGQVGEGGFCISTAQN